jgi:3-isopropylmalate/(R)-2-methylmalate dehydratase large subunit
MVAKPGDPTFGVRVAELEQVKIDIAYAGSCTAGKEHDLDFYAQVLGEATQAGLRVASGVQMFIQFGSESVREYARQRGYMEIFERAGVTVIEPGCGACIGCGPGVSSSKEQVTVSAINRNFQGRSGPGKLYLASPLTVAASAVMGRIASWAPGMFQRRTVAAART